MFKKLVVIWMLFHVSQIQAKTTMRKYAGAMYSQNDSGDYDDSYGAFFAGEIDFSDGYLSAGQGLSYFESQATDETIVAPVSPSRWISDLVISPYGKLRVPSTQKPISLFGNLGLDLHLAHRQLINEPDQYKSNWTLGWSYGGGLELRIKQIAIDARVNFKRVFGADYTYLNTNEIIVGIALISQIK